jgi:hypothetical protein
MAARIARGGLHRKRNKVAQHCQSVNYSQTLTALALWQDSAGNVAAKNPKILPQKWAKTSIVIVLQQLHNP